MRRTRWMEKDEKLKYRGFEAGAGLKSFNRPASWILRWREKETGKHNAMQTSQQTHERIGL